MRINDKFWHLSISFSQNCLRCSRGNNLICTVGFLGWADGDLKFVASVKYFAVTE